MRARSLAASLALVLCASCTHREDTLSLHGTGASLPLPLYSRWVVDFEAQEPKVRVNYQALGSGAGVKQMLEGTVDFGATDTPLQDAELARCPEPVAHVPTTLGAVVVALNLPSVREIDLRGDTLAAIFLGEITRFDDPRIRAENPGVPGLEGPITVVHRSDGSGTTRVLTEYLARTSGPFRDRVGSGRSVRWPTGVGAKGNEGVGAQIQRIPGALGYVEVARARSTNLATVRLENRAGHFVRVSNESVTAAALARPMPEDLRGNATDTEGAEAYPLATYSFVILPKNNKDARKGVALARFLWWALHDGQRAAERMHYTPLPPSVVVRAEGVVRELRAAGATVELTP